jgi:MFS family permease
VPAAIILALGSPMMGQLAGRIGARLPLTIGPLVVAGGFLLQLRMGAQVNYWRDVLPAVLVISIGMAGAVAPLTNAVLGAVDQRHTGSASGFNSAIARTGGLIATALLGSVLGAKGDSLMAGFHTAALGCVIACIAASAAAFFLITAPERK